MTKDEALKLALEALKKADWNCPVNTVAEGFVRLSITAIKEALSQPEQEPVAMRYDFDGYGWKYIDNGHGSNWRERVTHLDAEDLYTTPPKRTWVGLTDDEFDKIYDQHIPAEDYAESMAMVAAKLKEKNT